MVKYLIKLSTFTILITSIYGVYSFMMPIKSSNQYFSVKRSYLEKKIDKYNTFFLGSSKVYRQVNPYLFDSIINNEQKDVALKSFNFGIPAGTLLESYAILDKILMKNNKTEIKYIFIELRNVPLLTRKTRDNYWFKISDYLFLQKLIFDKEDLTLKNRAGATLTNTKNYLNSFFNTDFLDNLVKVPYGALYLGKLKNGYLSLEEQVEKTNNEAERKYIQNRRVALKNDTLVLVQSKLKHVKERYTHYETKRKKHLKRILSMINKAKKKDIQLIFFISPRSQNLELLSLFEELPLSNKLEFSNDKNFNKLFNSEYLFDKGHFNSKGAELYTKMFAEEFIKLLNHTNH